MLCFAYLGEMSYVDFPLGISQETHILIPAEEKSILHILVNEAGPSSLYETII